MGAPTVAHYVKVLRADKRKLRSDKRLHSFFFTLRCFFAPYAMTSWNTPVMRPDKPVVFIYSSTGRNVRNVVYGEKTLRWEWRMQKIHQTTLLKKILPLHRHNNGRHHMVMIKLLWLLNLPEQRLPWLLIFLNRLSRTLRLPVRPFLKHCPT